MRSINDYIPTLIQIIVLVYVLFRLYQTMVRAGHRVPLVFFTFAMAGFLLSDLYWMTFDILYPTTRMPFAANEICECALFLSLASTLAAMTATLGTPAKWETLFTLVFIAANTALWIAWSGEWVQDIITGLVLGYLSIRLVKHMKQTGALPSAVWKILGIIFVLVIMAHIATFLVPEQFKDGCDLTAYLLMLGVVVYFVLRAVKSLTKGTDPQAAISLSFASCTLSYNKNVRLAAVPAGANPSTGSFAEAGTGVTIKDGEALAVMGVEPGTVKLTGITTDGSKKKVKCTVTVRGQVTGMTLKTSKGKKGVNDVTLSDNAVTTDTIEYTSVMKANSKMTLKPVVDINGVSGSATDKATKKTYAAYKKYTDTSVSYRSSDTSVATVDKKGKISVKKGTAGKTATIYVVSADGKQKAEILITVK